MTTSFNDWIEKVWRRVYSGSADATVQLGLYNSSTNTWSGGISSSDITFSVTPPSGSNPSTVPTNALRVGAVLSIDLEVMYVTGYNNTSNSVTVVRGYEGSVAAAHTGGTLVYIQPVYTKFDVGVALNDELLRLSSPGNGLFKVGVETITYNPVYMGYDLAGIPTNFIDVMEIRHKIPYPTRNYPSIKKWKVLRSIPDAGVFPSGAGIVVYESGYPGMPMYVQYSAPFTTVDPAAWASTSDVAAATGMTATMVDIPPLGAEIQLTLPREIRRNFMNSQPDPRKAPEVPAGSISNSVQALMMTYNSRISEEADRLMRQYTRVEGW